MRAPQTTLALAPLLIIALAIPALAQPSAPATNYPACTNKPTPQDSEAAHSAYNLGKRFFDEADYNTAIHNFADAYKLDCTKPELLLNIARANELSGNRPEAVHALETYLQRATSATPDEKAQLQRRIDNLKALIVPQAPTASTPPVAPPPTSTATVPASTATTPPGPLPPVPPAPERHHTAVPWVVAGVGVASGVAGIVTYVIGAGDISTAKQTCPNTTNCKSASAVSQGQTGDTLEIAGSVMAWGGLAVAAGGVLWHFLEPTGPAADPPKVSITPAVGPGYTGASVVGRF